MMERGPTRPEARAIVEDMYESEAEQRQTGSVSGPVAALRGFLNMCWHCKKVRDAEGLWKEIESYLCRHAQVSHGLCPDCIRELYPEDADAILDDLPS